MLLVIGSQACEEYETPVPSLEKFGIYEIEEELAAGELSLNSIPANTTVRMQAFTEADICVIWSGEFSYRPYPVGTSDSLLDSHAYEHYGQVGAQGHTTGSIKGDDSGWFLDYSWEPGSYTVTVVLTNHGTAGPDYQQITEDFSITVQ